MKRLNKRNIRVVGVLCATLAILVGVSPGAQGDPELRASKIRTLEEVQPWSLAKILGPHLIEISADAETCTGLERPRIKAQVSEHRRSAVITAVVRREVAGDCLQEDLFVNQRVHLSRSLGARTLFDGSTTPPVRRWPK